MVTYQPDGLGPCTTVECLLHASMEAARSFIFEQQMKASMHHEDNYYGQHGDYGDYGHEMDEYVDC